jgi:hypothetical protein
MTEKFYELGPLDKKTLTCKKVEASKHWRCEHVFGLWSSLYNFFSFITDDEA